MNPGFTSAAAKHRVTNAAVEKRYEHTSGDSCSRKKVRSTFLQFMLFAHDALVFRSGGDIEFQNRIIVFTPEIAFIPSFTVIYMFCLVEFVL